jgi:hypothetical protein
MLLQKVAGEINLQGSTTGNSLYKARQSHTAPCDPALLCGASQLLPTVLLHYLP